MLTDFFRSFLSYNVRRAPEDTPSEISNDEPTPETKDAAATDDEVPGTFTNPTDLSHATPPPTPTTPTQPASPKRGRPAKRLTSSKRICTKAGSKKLSSRKPLNPTTKTAIAKERRHRLYEKKRARQAQEDRLLSEQATYWIVLRSGKKYRSFGGTRRS
ncbi:hypothetical protein B0A55_07766 [Friedmanniomyces simplex]|uniref:Uncharacterized protein n=1 Tax=Friedmanniomyces simplex TaxID=329884 RepID=A0A4V5NHL3_9PEZI|nr:hypothetical protein B0A55_07766 [Friedmanniomyces simplex]